MILLLRTFVLPLAISGLLTALLVRWAPRLGLIDQPAARKVHSRPTPKGGGLAIYAALAAATACLPSAWGHELLTVLGAGAGIVALGLVDDLRPLPWQLRLCVQMAVVAVVVVLWPASVGWVWRAVAVLWVTALVNAFNMLDNMDALSAGVAWIAAGMFLLAGVARQGTGWEWRVALPYVLLMGALTGFLWFNRPPARIFMGDAGSTFLGLFLGIFSLHEGLDCPEKPWTLAVPLCVLAVPCYDMTTVVLLRLWQGRSPFHADKQHLSHRLTHLCLSRPAAVGVIYLLAAASGLCGLLLYDVSPKGAILVVLLLACVWLAVASIEYFRYFLPLS